jgi:alkanesulfonate monooxygenase SsuD/methylene tetrahydromethanopterin reductase-like flavin-dependent oxidoreductase (luciferase family)
VAAYATVRHVGVFDHLDRGGADTAAFFAQRLALTECYDRLGFYSYHVAEHHATPLGLASSPNVFLAMVAGRTQRLRLGALVYLLPLYQPLRLLEELCMLDQMSGGRLDVGLGRGISPIEARYCGADPELTQAMFEEAHEVLTRGFGAATLDFHGRFYHYDGVPLEIHPLQQPRPPFWYGISSPESAERCARSGFNVLTLNPPARAAQALAPHRAAAPDLLAGIGRFIVVAETDEAALEIAEAAYPQWYASFNALYRKFGRGPMQGERPTTFAGQIAEGTGIAGSPATVLRALDAQIRQTGSNYLVGQFAFGNMPAADSLQSIELFARDVMPHLLGRAEVMPAS